MLDVDRPARSTRQTVVVVGLAAVCVALYVLLVSLHTTLYGASLPLVLLLGAGVCGAPLVALRLPRTAVAVFTLTALLLPLTVSPDRDPVWPWPWSVPALIAFALYVGVVAFRRGWQLGLLALVAGLAGSLIVVLLLPDATTAPSAVADLIVTASIATIVYGIALLVAGRLRLGEELDRERGISAAEQTRRVMIEERARIAREMHDVVAHSMSLIQVQASTARYRLPDLAPDAAAEFDDIAATARGSLAEMRLLLGVLRTEDQVAEYAPQQGIADIAALVDGIRKAGVRVDLHLEPPAEVPAAVEITAFRITQEALSNAVRHAPGAAVRVWLTADDPGAILLRVRNAPSPQRPGAGKGPARTGHGLRGMHERATLLGGTVEAGQDPDDGWTVTAVLPLTPTGSLPKGTP